MASGFSRKAAAGGSSSCGSTSSRTSPAWEDEDTLARSTERFLRDRRLGPPTAPRRRQIVSITLVARSVPTE